jgi:hypothetical protein
MNCDEGSCDLCDLQVRCPVRLCKLALVASVFAGPDLTGYTLVFDEEFNGPLSVSAYGPGTKWIAHTPYKGDFGEAWFCNPIDPKSPFSIKTEF